MTGKMILRPGTPDDDNREYLPEKIKGSDIVVNENGNNSQPYPERLKECHGVIADNIEDEWYEHVPDTACSFYAWRVDDRMGTGNLYFLDNGGRQGRIYFGISKCQ